MKRRTKSLLDELNSMGDSLDNSYLMENTAVNLVAGVTNLIKLIHETYKDDKQIANDLEKRLINSIRSGDETKFTRGINVARKNSKK